MHHEVESRLLDLLQEPTDQVDTQHEAPKDEDRAHQPNEVHI